MNCRRCGRVIRNPKSVRNGMGPVCARKAAAQHHRVAHGEAHFMIVSDTPEALTIRDVGPWDKYMTVTNAAEWVVQQLVAEGLLPDGKRLFVYDSQGDLDEFVIFCGRFAGFKPGPNRVATLISGKRP